MATKLSVYHVPVCPFSQRLEILLALKGQSEAVRFHMVDITKPRDPALLVLTRGTTALPVMVTEHGVLKESLVLLRYLDERFPEPEIARPDPYARAVENMMIALENSFTKTGYRMVMNQEQAKRDQLERAMLAEYRKLDDFLSQHSPFGTYLFERFGLAEAVFTPMFMRFWALDYYENFALPAEGYDRVRRWRDACLRHPAAQQVTRDEILKISYDYTKGAGTGAVLPGRRRSSFALEPNWRTRPLPPPDKYSHFASDAELGLM